MVFLKGEYNALLDSAVELVISLCEARGSSCLHTTMMMLLLNFNNNRMMRGPDQLVLPKLLLREGVSHQYDMIITTDLRPLATLATLVATLAVACDACDSKTPLQLLPPSLATRLYM